MTLVNFLKEKDRIEKIAWIGIFLRTEYAETVNDKEKK